MDPNNFQHTDHTFDYNFLNYEVPSMAIPNAGSVPTMATDNMSMPPPMSAPYTNMSHAVPSSNSTIAPNLHIPHAYGQQGNEGQSVCNDSGYFSSPQTPNLSTPANHSQGTVPGQLGVNYNHSPTKIQNSAIANLSGVSRTNWQEEFPNINDEWDRNFINTFEENLFGFDAADLTSMVDGILNSPLKSPLSSPFKSPRQSRSAATGLGLSPFNNPSTSNVMLTGVRRSPRHTGGSPFRNLFATPSPVKGPNPHTRPSPMTRQRRRILQSPANKYDVTSDNLLDLPTFLDNVKVEVQQPDSLGMSPLQRTNSMGFTPTEDLSSSPTFPYLFKESSVPSTQFLLPDSVTPPQDKPAALVTSSLDFQETRDMTQLKPAKRIKTENTYNLRTSPARNEPFVSKQRSPSRRKSPAQGRISVTRHAYLMENLCARDVLHLVRARFKEVLDKATTDAVVKEKRLQAKLKAAQKRQQYPEISQALSQPVGNTSNAVQTGMNIASYAPIHTHRPAGKRRQEILPKPTPDWPQRPPCKIAPKKRRR